MGRRSRDVTPHKLVLALRSRLSLADRVSPVRATLHLANALLRGCFLPALPSTRYKTGVMHLRCKKRQGRPTVTFVVFLPAVNKWVPERYSAHNCAADPLHSTSSHSAPRVRIEVRPITQSKSPLVGHLGRRASVRTGAESWLQDQKSRPVQHRQRQAH